MAKLREWARNARGESPVDGLGERIQTRFHTLDDFGISRLPLVHQHAMRFDPETPEEKESVSRLRDAGWDVAFYLGSRKLLGPEPSKAEWAETDELSKLRAISRAIHVTDTVALAELPDPRDLWAHGREVLGGTPAGPLPGTLGRWSVVASPIRADRKACLDCHRAGGVAYVPAGDTGPLRVGDALGVVVFVYSRSQKSAEAGAPVLLTSAQPLDTPPPALPLLPAAVQ